MKTPVRADAEQFYRDLDVWRKLPGCERCGETLVAVRAYISIHAIEFDECSGTGRCDRLDIPYCPRCEPEPEKSGCIHLKMFQHPTGMELIQAGKCPIGATSPISCMFCPFGHLTECHHPKKCAEAQCSHYRTTDEC